MKFELINNQRNCYYYTIIPTKSIYIIKILTKTPFNLTKNLRTILLLIELE